ncbi:protein phosphatase 2C domain-containing protein [Sulfuritalea sp.]|uniref:PP2C family protein-serine/threonine phosphatase n=1 Tax=Sulfuritalea sp. TaxID=2480090 RepID=UPI00286D7CF6|nr:protein phosphatase 2C domain-containing protein [Sulfuritalea sp.]
MNYTIVQDSRIGGREINQDRVAWLATDDAVLMVVADGMGGHLQGEVAAQLAVDTISERFRAAAKARLVDPAQFLAAALRQAHESIVRYAADCRIPPHAAPRTTCIACVVQDGQVNWAHAGDSRLYLIHGRAKGDAAFMRTRDHSLVQRMVDDGIIESGQAASHPLRNRVFSCLGGDLMPSIEVSRTVSLQDGDVIALCTDGAWAPLGEKLVRELGRASLTTSVPHLLDAAEQAAGPQADNLTLIAMRWEAPDPDAHTLNLRPDALPTNVAAPISDEELDDAVAEIRRRMPYTP